MKYSRRSFLEFLGRGSIVSLASVAGLSYLSSCKNSNEIPVIEEEYAALINFKSVAVNDLDEVVLADGFSQDVLIKLDDALSPNLSFGTHSDYLAFIPLNEDASEGLLWSNHEYLDPILLGTNASLADKTIEQVHREQAVVGGSIVHIYLEENKWKYKSISEYNNRLDANSKIPFLWDEPIDGADHAIGTFAGCAGGITPWGTILSCEENTDQFYGEYVYDEQTGERIGRLSGNYHWEKFYEYSPEHYGWVVEVDPKTGEAHKLIALGRFAHECATVHELEDGRVVIYTGDDGNDRCLYKYVSAAPKDLKNGTLYVANIEKGEWIPLIYDESEILQEHFKSQTEVLVRMREAAYLVGGSKLNRPEDIEIDPVSGDVFISLTNNKPKGDLHGSILKLTEDSNDKTGLTFSTETFLAGSKQAGFSSPDNLAFDTRGNLWFTTDVGGSTLGSEGYEFMPCNALFLVPRTGEKAGELFRVATAPKDAEFTGPFFHPSGKYLFLSVQHPGETTTDLNQLTSHWPDGGDTLPKSGVIVISGESLEQLLT